MAAALRINATSGQRSSSQERKRKFTGSLDGKKDKLSPSVLSDKYVHVHHYVDTGRWGTWFNDPTLKRGSGKRRLYFGTYETEYLAARAQDRAALKFKPYAVRPVTRLNFAESDYVLDKDLRDKLTHGQFRRLLMAESRKCYKRAEPSPCWRIFLEEEAAKGNIHIEFENRSNRYHREPRTFTQVLEEIVSKDEAGSSEEITEPIGEPVTTGEKEGKVYIAKRTRRPTQAAPNQPAHEGTKELVAEDPAALPVRSLSARQVRKAAPEAAPPVRHDARSASLSARQVRKAAPVAAPPVRHDARSASLSAPRVRKATPKAAPPVRRDAKRASLSARQVGKATPKAAPPVRHDTRSASLSAPRVRKAPPTGAPPVRRRDKRNPSQSARPVPQRAPEAAPPVRRREPSVFKQGVRRAEGEGRTAVQTSQQSPVYQERLKWGTTRGRSTRYSDKLSLPNAASTTDDATVATGSTDLILMAANTLSQFPNRTSGTSHGKEALGSDHTTVESPSKPRRLNIDLNREPEPSSSSTGGVSPSSESDDTVGNQNLEVTSVETLLLLRAGWLI